MSSIFNNPMWFSNEKHISPHKDLLDQDFNPITNIGTICFVIFGKNVYDKVVESIPHNAIDLAWPYKTNEIKCYETPNGNRFSLHFPSYGSTRVANSLEILSSMGVKRFLGLGIGGTPQDNIQIGDTILLEGSVRGDGASRYYAPIEFPAVADFQLVRRISKKLEAVKEPYHIGLSFSTDALYRETHHLVAMLKDLGVLLVDLESSAFLSIGRRLGLQCAWVGVVSDRLVGISHEGIAHSEPVIDHLLNLSRYMLQIIGDDE